MIGPEGVRDVALNRIGNAFARQFSHDIARIVHHIRVITSSTEQCIGASSAIQAIVARQAGERIDIAVAGEHVVPRISRAVHRGKTGQCQMFDVSELAGQVPRDAGVQPVSAIAGKLGDRVVDIVDPIRVITRPADQAVRPRPAIEGIVERPAGERIHTGIADQDVAQIIPRPIDVAGAGQRQIFELGAGQAVRKSRHDGVDAIPGRLGDAVAGDSTQDIGVISSPAIKDIVPRAAIERVVTPIAGQRVGYRIAAHEVIQRIPGAAGGTGNEDQIFYVISERVIEPGIDGIDAFAVLFSDGVGTVDEIGIVACPADQGIGSGGPIEKVIAAIAGQHVRQRVAGRVNILGPRECQILDLASKREGDRTLNSISCPPSSQFDDRIGTVIHKVRVVP